MSDPPAIRLKATISARPRGRFPRKHLREHPPGPCPEDRGHEKGHPGEDQKPTRETALGQGGAQGEDQHRRTHEEEPLPRMRILEGSGLGRGRFPLAVRIRRGNTRGIRRGDSGGGPGLNRRLEGLQAFSEQGLRFPGFQLLGLAQAVEGLSRGPDGLDVEPAGRAAFHVAGDVVARGRVELPVEIGGDGIEELFALARPVVVHLRLLPHSSTHRARAVNRRNAPKASRSPSSFPARGATAYAENSALETCPLAAPCIE